MIEEDTRSDKDRQTWKLGLIASGLVERQIAGRSAPTRRFEKIEADLRQIENEIADMLSQVTE